MTERENAMPEKQSSDAVEWARVFRETTRQFEEKDRELRAQMRVLEAEQAMLRERIRARRRF